MLGLKVGAHPLVRLVAKNPGGLLEFVEQRRHGNPVSFGQGARKVQGVVKEETADR